MTAQNGTAKAVGILFIVTMLLGMVDAYTVAPLLNQPLDHISTNESRVFMGAFSILFMSIGVVGIALLLFPVLERFNRFIAIDYLAARVMECLLLITGVVVYFLLIILSRNFVDAGSPGNSHFQTLNTLLIEARYGTYHIAMILLGIASMMFCYLFYRSALIPRLISITGLIG